MIRVAEIVLFLLPLLAFVVWRRFGTDRMPSWTALGGFAAVLAVVVGGLIWLRSLDAEPTDRVYVPSHMEGGKIVDRPVGQ